MTMQIVSFEDNVLTWNIQMEIGQGFIFEFRAVVTFYVFLNEKLF